MLRRAFLPADRGAESSCCGGQLQVIPSVACFVVIEPGSQFIEAPPLLERQALSGMDGLADKGSELALLDFPRLCGGQGGAIGGRAGVVLWRGSGSVGRLGRLARGVVVAAGVRSV